MSRIALDLFLLIEKESTGIFFGTGWFEKTVGVSSGNFWPKKTAGGTSTGFSKNPPRFSGQVFRPIEYSLKYLVPATKAEIFWKIFRNICKIFCLWGLRMA